MADAAVGWNERGRTRAAMASGGGVVLLRRESIRVEKCMEIVGTIFIYFKRIARLSGYFLPE